MSEELKTVRDFECNILTNKIDLDKMITWAICPECKLIKSASFIGKECLKCSIHVDEKDPLSEWKKRTDFIKIELPEEKLNLERGYLKEDLKAESIKWVKKLKKSLNIGEMLKEQAGENAFNDIEEIEKGKIEFIMEFFNLTEEDLKEQEE